jgi:hypothetical protein
MTKDDSVWKKMGINFREIVIKCKFFIFCFEKGNKSFNSMND